MSLAGSLHSRWRWPGQLALVILLTQVSWLRCCVALARKKPYDGRARLVLVMSRQRTLRVASGHGKRLKNAWRRVGLCGANGCATPASTRFGTDFAISHIGRLQSRYTLWFVHLLY